VKTSNLTFILLSSVLWLNSGAGSSFITVTRLRARRPGFDSRQGQRRDFSSPRPDRLRGPFSFLPNGQRGGGWSFPATMRLIPQSTHSPPCNSEVRMRVAVPPLPQYIFMAWFLVKHSNNLTFTVAQ
jgi:hypothetical protein